MLALAARHADILGVSPAPITAGVLATNASASLPDSVATKVDVIRQAAAGRFSQLEPSMVVSRVVTQHRRSAAADFARTRACSSVSSEEVLTMPSALIGTVGEIAEHVQACRERYGLSYLIVSDRDTDALSAVIGQLREM